MSLATAALLAACGDSSGTGGGSTTATTGSGGSAPQCGSLDVCGGECVDTDLDPSNCGACGTACPAGEVCSVGQCGTVCLGGTTLCGALCVNTDNDPANCGACNMPCTGGEVCGAGTCAVSCPTGQVECGGLCVDPDGSPGNCGAKGTCVGTDPTAANYAGEACGPGEVCVAGTCAVSCPTGQVECGGLCVDPDDSMTNCGASGTCVGNTPGTNYAGEACAQGEACVSGACVVSCPTGQIDCGGSCVDPDASPTNCGASGTCIGNTPGTNYAGEACGPGEVCSAGSCEASCASPLIDCAGGCIDPDASTTYCGATGDCMGGNAGSTCTGGQVCINGACSGITASSCRQIHLAAPNLPSGNYTIDPDGIGPKPSSVVYCDMVTDGGGYTWAKFTDASLTGDQNAYKTYCSNLGMEVIVPRTKAHAIALAAQLGGTLPSLYNIYPNSNGATSIYNWHGTCQGVNCSFWMTDDVAGNVQCSGFEPNGNNNTAFMIYHYDVSVINDACASAVAPGVPGHWDDAANAVSMPGTVVCSTNDFAPPPNGEAGSDAAPSCNAIHTNYPALPSGTYWIDPDGPAGASTAFRAYCDMTTDGGGWTQVFKTSAGALVDDNTLWSSGAPVNDAAADCFSTTTMGANAFCVNKLVTNLWNTGGATFTSARVHAYTGGTVMKFMRFNGLTTDKIGWFALGSLASSSWTDLAGSTPNVFSIAGDAQYGRNWFVSQMYAGCGADSGWFIVSGTGGAQNKPCGWETIQGAGTRIFYANTMTATNWNTAANIAAADVMMVLVR